MLPVVFASAALLEYRTAQYNGIESGTTGLNFSSPSVLNEIHSSARRYPTSQYTASNSKFLSSHALGQISLFKVPGECSLVIKTLALSLDTFT